MHKKEPKEKNFQIILPRNPPKWCKIQDNPHRLFCITLRFVKLFWLFLKFLSGSNRCFILILGSLSWGILFKAVTDLTVLMRHSTPMVKSALKSPHYACVKGYVWNDSLARNKLQGRNSPQKIRMEPWLSQKGFRNPEHLQFRKTATLRVAGITFLIQKHWKV